MAPIYNSFYNYISYSKDSLSQIQTHRHQYHGGITWEHCSMNLSVIDCTFCIIHNILQLLWHMQGVLVLQFHANICSTTFYITSCNNRFMRKSFFRKYAHSFVMLTIHMFYILYFLPYYIKLSRNIFTVNHVLDLCQFTELKFWSNIHEN